MAVAVARIGGSLIAQRHKRALMSNWLGIDSERWSATIGLHRATLMSGTALTGDKRRPYIIIVTNGDSAMFEAAGSINTAFFKLHSF